MKKTTIKILFIMFLAITYTGVAQTLNQNAMWPNGAWSVTGTYNTDPLAFEANPTVDANFAFDDDDAGTGSDDDIAAESPVIDLTAAHGAGETWITISGNFVYNHNNDDILQYEYWDADASTWNIIGLPITADTPTPPQNDFCGGTTEVYTTDILNIAGFTATQLSGFRYRIYFDDTAGGTGYEWGFCFDAPTITSATPPACPDPVVLTATNIDGFSADLGWTENGTATTWNIELVDITAAGTATGTATASGVTNSFNQTGLTPSNNYEFYVQADCGVDGTSAWVGPFAFTTTVACPDPSALTVTNIMTTSANLGWTAGASETLWDIEIVDITAGGTATGTATASGVTNAYNATGLTDNNDYEFYVQADCGGGNTSTWVGPFAFTTLCNPYTVPYNENFDSTATNSVPDCWSFIDSGVGYGYVSATGANSFYIYNYYDGTGDYILVSPPTTSLTSGMNRVRFDVDGSTGQDFIIGTMSDATDSATFSAIETITLATNNYESYTVDIPSGTDTFLAFKHGQTGTYDSYYLDNIFVEAIPSCIEPSALTVTNIMQDSANLSWTPGGSEVLWNVEIVTSGTMPTGTPTVTGVTNSYTATGLTAATDYEYYLQADCGGGDTSAWVGPMAFLTECAAFTPEYNADMSVNVPNCWKEADNGDTASGPMDLGSSSWVASNHSGTPSNRFNLYSSGRSDWIISPQIDLSTAAPSELKVYVALTEGGTSGSGADLGSDDVVSLLMTTDNGANWSTLQSWEQGNVPTDIGEEITYDLSAQTGIIQFAFLAEEGAVDDTEDIYFHVSKFQVRETPPCTEPSSLMVNSITATSADLSWTENGTATLWNVEIVTSGTMPTGTPTATGVANPYEATGLTAETDYEYYVQADCGVDGTSSWVGPFSFTTIESCPDPSALTATSITATTVDLGWTENGGASLWNIELVDITASGTATGTPTSSGVSNLFNLTGLTAANSYEFYVQSDCGGGELSGWAGPYAFNTQCDSPPSDVPFLEDFEGANCGTIINNGSGATQWQIVSATGYGFTPDHLRYTYDSNNAADTWYFTTGVNLTGGESYTITYDYGGTGSYFAERLKVAYGTSPTTAAMTNPLDDYPNVVNSTPLNGSNEFTPATSGVYYFGFQCYSVADKFYLHLDNISVDVTLSTEEFGKRSLFTYYPNPVENKLTLSAKYNIENVDIYNILGAKVLTTSPNTLTKDIDTSRLTAGTYFVQVTVDGVTDTIKIIKK